MKGEGLDTKRYDVAVCGAGIAGIAAAIAAARHGMSVVLIEKQCIIGGLATSGLINIYLPLCDGYGHKTSGGLNEEMIRRCVEYGPFDLPDNWGGPAGGNTGVTITAAANVLIKLLNEAYNDERSRSRRAFENYVEDLYKNERAQKRAIVKSIQSRMAEYLQDTATVEEPNGIKYLAWDGLTESETAIDDAHYLVAHNIYLDLVEKNPNKTGNEIKVMAWDAFAAALVKEDEALAKELDDGDARKKMVSDMSDEYSSYYVEGLALEAYDAAMQIKLDRLDAAYAQATETVAAMTNVSDEERALYVGNYAYEYFTKRYAWGKTDSDDYVSVYDRYKVSEDAKPGGNDASKRRNAAAYAWDEIAQTIRTSYNSLLTIMAETNGIAKTEYGYENDLFIIGERPEDGTRRYGEFLPNVTHVWKAYAWRRLLETRTISEDLANVYIANIVKENVASRNGDVSANADDYKNAAWSFLVADAERILAGAEAQRFILRRNTDASGNSTWYRTAVDDTYRDVFDTYYAESVSVLPELIIETVQGL